MNSRRKFSIKRLLRQHPCLYALSSVLALGSGSASADAPPEARLVRVPRGVSASVWSSIRAAYEANRHAAFASDGGYQARNPGQQWQMRFDGRGFVVIPDSDRWSWGLELVSYGANGAEHAVAGVAPVVWRCGQRVEYRWNATLTEFFVNDSRGLEHGYVVHRRPENLTGATPVRHESRAQTAGPWGYLQFILAIHGDLRPQVSRDGGDITFVNAGGAAVVTYHGLTVLDAAGTAVPARFEQAGAQLRLRIDDRTARYPLTIDPIAQRAYLKASNTSEGDEFGFSVAVSGNTVVVGASGEDSSATGVDGDQTDNIADGSGAAYVFIRDGTTWNQQAYLKASNTGPGDHFGWSVALSGDTLVVGAYQEASSATGVDGDDADDNASGSGAAYVFVRSGTTWSQQAYLKASNTGAGDQFGWSVAVSGDTIVVGANAESSNATGVDGNQADNSAFHSGAAYVFVRSGATWSQQAYLKASNTGAIDNFGWSAAVSGDTVVIGAHVEDSNATGVEGNQADNSQLDSGAAYVFVRSGATWSQQVYLKASNTGAVDFFGFSLALSGDTLVVGANGEDSGATGVEGNQADNSQLDSGAAYVFVRSGTIWSQEAYLKASNTGAGDQFGNAVAVSGNTVVVAAALEDSSATGVDGNQIDESALNAGAAYVFVRNDLAWSQKAYLKASNPDADDLFGFFVALSGDTAVVGAEGEDGNATGVNGDQADNSAELSGAAYVFDLAHTSGDMNCDGVFDILDAPPLALALSDSSAYGQQFQGCNPLNGDMNHDLILDGLDIGPFVDCLINGGCQ